MDAHTKNTLPNSCALFCLGHSDPMGGGGRGGGSAGCPVGQCTYVYNNVFM